MVKEDHLPLYLNLSFSHQFNSIRGVTSITLVICNQHAPSQRLDLIHCLACIGGALEDTPYLNRLRTYTKLITNDVRPHTYHQLSMQGLQARAPGFIWQVVSCHNHVASASDLARSSGMHYHRTEP